MKTNTRAVPLDMLSVQEGKRRILISTHRQEIVFDSFPVDGGAQARLTFAQLYSLIAELEARQQKEGE